MLINKGISSGEVITLMLSTGVEVVAKLVEETDNYYKVSKPLALTMTQRGPGLTPFIYTIDQDTEIKINKPVILCEHTGEDEAKQYLQSTSGISLL